MAIQQGWSSQTAAAQNTIRRALGSAVRGAVRRGVRKAAKRATGKRKSAKRASASKRNARPARLVKGSLAAKRYMAKIRKLRK